MSTPMKPLRHSRSGSLESGKDLENFHPNVPARTPSKKPTMSPASKSAPRSRKAIGRLLSPPPPPPPRDRKFVVAKKKNLTGQESDLEPKKRQEAAYEALRSSQEEFFRKDMVPVLKAEEAKKHREGKDGEVKKKENLGLDLGSKERKTMSMVMEEALSNIPESGSGRVKHLVKAFESLLLIPEGEESAKEERKSRFMNWLLPGLPPNAAESEGGLSSPSFVSSAESLPFGLLEREPRLCSSLDGHDCRLSLVSRISGGGRNRRHSYDSSRKSWNKSLKVTSLKPFKLRTEQRGRTKELMFAKKVTEMLMEEERRRIPIAQGLPWTTDEPECLVKPLVKECTEPIDVVLHSDVRAVERAEFDHYVADRLEFAERIKLEREMQRKMEEEEKIKKLRRELVPRAQPMPYFDRPFIPKKSRKPQTIPKEPKFHIRSAKAS